MCVRRHGDESPLMGTGGGLVWMEYVRRPERRPRRSLETEPGSYRFCLLRKGRLTFTLISSWQPHYTGINYVPKSSFTCAVIKENLFEQ